MDPDPRISEALESLLQADQECEQLIKEVEEYDWDHDGYPLGLGFIPYPEKDMDHFHERGRDAKNLKTRVQAILGGLGASSDQWLQHIKQIDFYEGYALSNPFIKPKRPSVSGLAAARGVLKAAIQTLQSAIPLSDATDQPGAKRSMGSPQAVKACEQYMSENSLTRKEFGESFGTTDRTVRNFLAKGKIATSLFRAMAEKMGISPKELHRGEWPPRDKRS